MGIQCREEFDKRRVQHPPVVPKGGGFAITSMDNGQSTVEGQFLVYNPSNEGVSTPLAKSSRVLTEKPVFSRPRGWFVQFMDKFQKQAVILMRQGSNAKASITFLPTNPVPGNKAFRPMASILTSPEECTSFLL